MLFQLVVTKILRMSPSFDFSLLQSPEFWEDLISHNQGPFSGRKMALGKWFRPGFSDIITIAFGPFGAKNRHGYLFTYIFRDANSFSESNAREKF